MTIEDSRLFSSLLTLILIGLLLFSSRNIRSYKITLKGLNKLNLSIYIMLLIMPLINIFHIINSPQHKINIFTSLFIGFYIGITEELIFRGFLLQALTLIQPKGIAILISSIAFGLFHLVNLGADPLILVLLQVIYATAIGVFFSCVVIITNSLLPVISAHALIDILSFFVLENSWKIDLVAMVLCIVFSVFMFTYTKQKQLLS